MKTKYLVMSALTLSVILTSLSSCVFHCVRGSGHQVTENHKLADFDKIHIEGGYKVVLKQDSSNTLTITADDNILKYITISNDDHRLHIYSKKQFCYNGQMILHIGVRNLQEIKASGAVEIEADGKLVTQDLHLGLSGASKITMELNAANLTTHSSGAIEMNIKGQATSHNLEVNGVGHINALDFVVGSYEIHTSGAAHCDINVLNSLTVHSSGASEVRYRGNPSNVINDKSGASSVDKIN